MKTAPETFVTSISLRRNRPLRQTSANAKYPESIKPFSALHVLSEMQDRSASVLLVLPRMQRNSQAARGHEEPLFNSLSVYPDKIGTLPRICPDVTLDSSTLAIVYKCVAQPGRAPAVSLTLNLESRSIFRRLT